MQPYNVQGVENDLRSFDDWKHWFKGFIIKTKIVSQRVIHEITSEEFDAKKTANKSDGFIVFQHASEWVLAVWNLDRRGSAEDKPN